MTWVWSLVAILLLNLVPFRVLAQHAIVSPPAPDAPLESMGDEPTEALSDGDVAPYSGILLPESRYAKLAMAELRVEALEASLKAEKSSAKETKALLDECLELSEDCGAWYDNFWVGAIVGITATAITAWIISDAVN